MKVGWKAYPLLQRVGDVTECAVGIRADQLDRSNHDYQNHRERDGVLRDILPALIPPKPAADRSDQRGLPVAVLITHARPMRIPPDVRKLGKPRGFDNGP